MELRRALEFIIEGSAEKIGYERAFFHDFKGFNMEFGWFDLLDRDSNAFIDEENECVILELWFRSNYLGNIPEESIIEVSNVETSSEGNIELFKVRVFIYFEDIDYIYVNGERHKIKDRV